MSGQQRSQRATAQKGSKPHQTYTEEYNEQLVSPDPHDQAQRWGTRSYSQQVYGQQGMEGAEHPDTFGRTGIGAYRGASTGGYNPRQTHKAVGTDEFDEDEPISHIYSEDSSAAHPQLHGDEDESRQSGMFGGIGHKMNQAMGSASKKAGETFGSGGNR